MPSKFDCAFNIEINADESGIHYTIFYSDGERVTLHGIGDLVHYLQCNERGLDPTEFEHGLKFL